MPSSIITYNDYLPWINELGNIATPLTRIEFDIYVQLLNAQQD